MKKTKLIRCVKTSDAIIADFNISSDEPVKFLMTGCRHTDHENSQHELALKHLQEAKDQDAYIFDVGDFFCVMQGPGDKRASMNERRAVNNNDDYFGSIIREASEMYGPYADRFLGIGEGNHETSIKSRYAFDMTRNFIERMNLEHRSNILNLKYTGWIFLRFFRGGKTPMKTVKIHYHHGAGGGGKTRGTANIETTAMSVPDANICMSAHIHNRYYWPIERERITGAGRSYASTQHHFTIPTYKEEYFVEERNNFHHRNRRPPKPLGAWWFEFNSVGKADLAFDFQSTQSQLI